MRRAVSFFSNGFEFTTKLFRTGNIVAISCGLLAGLCIGYYMPLISFWMHDLGYSGNEIGVNASSFPVLIFGAFMPRWMSYLGGFKSLMVSILGVMFTIILLPFFTELTLIYAMRFLWGLAFGIFWIASETWINMNADPKNRGVYISLYASLYGLGICLGPQFLKIVGVTGKGPFFFGLILFLPVLFAIIMIRKKIPVFHVPKLSRQKEGLFWQLPLAFLGVFMSGACEVSMSNLFSIFSLAKGLGTGEILSLLSVFALGNFLWQFPLGYLADRFDVYKVFFVNALVTASAFILISIFFSHNAILYPLMFILGGSIIGFYTLSLILLGHHFSLEEMTRANMFFIVCFTLGSLTGPFISGHLIDWAPDSFLYFLAVLVLIFAALVRMPRMHREIIK